MMKALKLTASIGIVTLAMLAVLLASGCSYFHYEKTLSDGSTIYIREWTGPLTNKQSGFDAKHEWLDEATNTIHEDSVGRNTDENADAQVAVIRILAEKLEAAYAAKLAAPGMNIPPSP